MKKTLPLALVLILYAMLGVLYAVRVPAWQAPDEPAHYNYTRELVETGQFPVIEASDWDARLVPLAPDVKQIPLARYTYEDHQPPLFYALAAPAYVWSGGALLALRLCALLAGGWTVVFAYLTTRAIAGEGTALFSAAFVALLPEHLYLMASFNNDALSEALLALVVWLCVRELTAAQPAAGELRTPRKLLGVLDPGLIMLAIAVGLGMFTKAQAYLSLPLAVLAVGWRWRAGVRAAAARVLALVLLAVVIPAQWWARNIATYGGLDVLGLQRHNAVVTGQPTTADWIARSGAAGWLGYVSQTTFQSFWGQFGWMSVLLDSRLYLAFLALSVLTAALFVVWWLGNRRAPTAARAPLLLLAALAAMTLAAFAWYNAQFVQAQGRYLYPALIPIAVAAGLGWQHALRRWPRAQRLLWLAPALGFAAFDLYALFRVILPAMR